MTTDSSPAQDWRGMRRADFDPDAPLALVDAHRVPRAVPAVPDRYGTDALFGEPPVQRRPARRSPAPSPATETDTLF